ncbi:MAG: HNH endonuclease [archaeon]
MKLEIELVPRTAWYSNLRTKIPQKEWDKIRKQSYSDAGNRCEICGAVDKLNCHEIWTYNDNSHTQKLEGFTALCDNCHLIKHIGFAQIQAEKGLISMERLVKHFMEVNHVGRNTFEKHHEESFITWEKRSKHNWTTDLSRWSTLVR